jgi:hypothetical protein
MTLIYPIQLLLEQLHPNQEQPRQDNNEINNISKIINKMLLFLIIKDLKSQRMKAIYYQQRLPNLPHIAITIRCQLFNSSNQ